MTVKEKILSRYNNKIVRSLIQLVPFGIGSAIDVYIKETIEKIKDDRLKTFFDQLERGEINLNDENIKSDKEFDKHSKLNNNQIFWREFEKVMSDKFNVTRDGLDEVLIRIERTGCLYIPRISSTDYRPYCAITTKIFSDLLKYISD